MELEVKIFFISDMLIVVVWKELIGEGLRRDVEVKIRGMNLGVCKSERRRRSIALNRDIGLYGRFGSELPWASFEGGVFGGACWPISGGSIFTKVISEDKLLLVMFCQSECHIRPDLNMN